MKFRSATSASVLAFSLALACAASAGSVWINVTKGGAADGFPDNWPPAEPPANAVDSNYYTKYLNFEKENTGFTVAATTPSVPVTRVIFATANDSPERDPASYVLEGSNDGGASWTQISAGNLDLPTGRNKTITDYNLYYQSVSFSNPDAYDLYRVAFPTVRNAGLANSMQIGEVSLLGLHDPGQNILELQSYTASGFGGDHPDAESPDKAIDGDFETKYLNFGKTGGGLLLSTLGDASVVTGLTLSQAGDAPNRDVTNFTLQGSNDGENFFDIVTDMELGAAMGLFEGNTVAFDNETAYRDYKFIVTGLRDGSATSFQFSELQLHGALIPETSVALLGGLGLLGLLRRRR